MAKAGPAEFSAGPLFTALEDETVGLVLHDEFSNAVSVLKNAAYAAGRGYVAAYSESTPDFSRAMACMRPVF